MSARRVTIQVVVILLWEYDFIAVITHEDMDGNTPNITGKSLLSDEHCGFEGNFKIAATVMVS